MSIGLEAQIGPLNFNRLPEFWLESRRHAPLTRCGLSFPDPDGSLYPMVAKGQSAFVSFGYLDDIWSVFSGTVESKSQARGQVKVEISGLDRRLLDRPFTQSFRNETPENILKWCAGQIQEPVGRIESTGLVMPRFMISGLNLYEVSQMLKASIRDAFNLDLRAWALWLGEKGLNFGDFDEPGEIPIIETGEMLLEHSPAGDPEELSKVTSFLIPDLRHSRVFVLSDAIGGVYARHRAQIVRHEINQGAARTYLWYGPEQGYA
jgi:hypothetical protein